MMMRAAFTERVAIVMRQVGLTPPQFPAPFFDAYLALMKARIVMAATSLGVVDALDDRPDDATHLAARLELDAGGVEVLLAALDTFGYVRRVRGGGRYRLTRTSRRWLARSSARSQATWIGAFSYDVWDHMGALEDALRGAPPIGLHDRPADDPYWERYQRGLAEVA